MESPVFHPGVNDTNHSPTHGVLSVETLSFKHAIRINRHTVVEEERDKVLPVPIHQGSSGEEDSALKCSAFGLEVCYGSSSGQVERSW